MHTTPQIYRVLVDLINSSGSAVASASFSSTNLFISGATGGTTFNGYTSILVVLSESYLMVVIPYKQL
jgi:hypothetical protein